MRAVIYARYSSDLQSETSIDDQVQLCREHADKLDANVTAVHTDYAISGSVMNRPGLQALLAEARDGKMDIVVSEALDRLSRDQEDIAGCRLQGHHECPLPQGPRR